MRNSTENMQTESMPFMENIFSEDDGKACLIGGKCAVCGQIYFPFRQSCVECDSDTMERIKFGGRGKLYSFTTSHMPSANFTAPYSTGFVEFAEGVRIFTPLRIKENQTPEIGADVVLVIDELWRKGKIGVMGYIYELEKQ